MLIERMFRPAGLLHIVPLLLASQVLGCGCATTASDVAVRGAPSSAVAQKTPNVSPESGSIGSKGASTSRSETEPWNRPPLDTDARLVDVRAALAKGEPATSVTAMQAAIATQTPPKDEVALWWLWLGMRLQATRHMREALTSYERAAAVGPSILRDDTTVRAARVALALGQPDKALALLGAVVRDDLSRQVMLVRIDALTKMGQTKKAQALWLVYLTKAPHGERWKEGTVQASLGLLVDPSDSGRATRALDLLRPLFVKAPASKQADRAKHLRDKALSWLTPAERRARRPLTPSEVWRQAEAWTRAGHRDRARDALERLVARWKPNERPVDKCETMFRLGKLVGRERRRRIEAAKLFAHVIDACQPHDAWLPKALYVGAKASASARRYPEALRRFERLERRFPSHRLSDDARLRGARVALVLGDDGLFEKKLRSMPDAYPKGDMVGDGLFALARYYIDKGRWRDALLPLKRSVKENRPEGRHWEQGRAAYFLARVYGQLNMRDHAAQLYARVMKEHVFSYYMLQASGRLQKLDKAKFDRVLADMGNEKGQGERTTLPESWDTGRLRRAVAWLRVGEVGRGASLFAQLRHDKPVPHSGWKFEGQLYERMNASRQAHLVARRHIKEIVGHFPGGNWREAWRWAYPSLYEGVLKSQTTEFGVRPALAYAIMREESAFQPDARSAARAYGLMQLILPTARMVGRPLGLRPTVADLLKPRLNIRLGCRLLSLLTKKFSATPELAIPSYNAGAGATKRWLRGHEGDPLDLWIERIPYRETRGYTKRVLSTRATYRYLYDATLSDALRLPLRVQH